jgi:outer membrane protein TolC
LSCLAVSAAFGQVPEPSAADPPPSANVREAEKRLRELEETLRQQKLEREQALLEADRSPPVEPLPNPDPSRPTPPVQEVPTPLGDAQAMGEALLLADVIASTYRAFPQIEIARLQAGVASGEITSALGAYDVKLDYWTLNQGVGFYENNRSGVALVRQLWWGGYAAAGYRIGRGNFEPWYKERETNRGGELQLGWIQPLLQGRAIDPYRVALFQSNLSRQAVGPEIQQNILLASLEASRIYWQWVEMGNVLRSQEALLELALKRNEILLKLFERGLSTRQELSINAQTISERQLKVQETRLKFRDTAFKLAFFLRDPNGDPMLADPDWLPSSFPALDETPLVDFQADFLAAQERRPELQLLTIDIQKLRWDLQLAQNQTLPAVDFEIRGGQDLGDRVSSVDDKQDFVLESGFSGGVPIQRRKARGKIEATLAKVQQTEQKRILQLNKIEVELRVARNNLEISREMVLRSEQLLRETRETLEYFRRDFAAGNRDFLFLLQQEAKVTESEIKLLDSERDYFIALASLQAAMGLDPLEQALSIDQLGQSAPHP